MRLPVRILLMLSAITATTPDGELEWYSFPLVDHFVVMKMSDAAKPFALGDDSHVIVDDLKSVGFSGHIVVGSCDKRYFILQAAVAPSYFDEMRQWLAARRALNVPDGLVVRTPNAIAATIDDRILNPFNYRLMHDFLGLSDDGWGGVVICGGLLLVFVRGVTGRPGAWLVTEAVILAVMADVLGGIILSGGGGGAFVGLFFYPVIYSISAKFGGLIGSAVHNRRKHLAELPPTTQAPETPPA